MSVIQVVGARPLSGEIAVQGSKNAVLPIMAAAILHQGVSVIENVPNIQDVTCMMGILSSLGCKVCLEGTTLRVDATDLSSHEICKADMEKMRSSMMLVGPLLARLKKAVAFYPGGCSIGKRPIDLHLYAFHALGAKVTEEDGRIEVEGTALRGACVWLSYPSVGATENAIMTAVLAEGCTKIYGCAREPEVIELCRFLRAMGVRILGEGTSLIQVEGECPLHDVKYRVAGDRIVAGTYLAATMCTRGEVSVRGIYPEDMEAVLEVFENMGANIQKQEDSVSILMRKRPLGGYRVKTSPFPGFPTDMQSILLSVFALADGENRIKETVFEGRFEVVKELVKFGAEISVNGRCVTVKGKEHLCGADVTAPDLRGGASLVLAGLSAEGKSEIRGYEHIVRGYASICEDFRQIGADIWLVL